MTAKQRTLEERLNQQADDAWARSQSDWSAYIAGQCPRCGNDEGLAERDNGSGGWVECPCGHKFCFD